MSNLIEQALARDLEQALAQICQTTNFSYGEIWLPNQESDLLELSPNYYAVANDDRRDFELFYECSKEFIMLKGEGLPGRVLQSQQVEWMIDVSVESEGSFLRNKIAGVCGIKTGFAIPVIQEKKVSAVLVFFTRSIRCYSPECLFLATDLVAKLLA